MSCGRICSRKVDLADPNEMAQKAAQRMKTRKVGTLVVLGEGQEPIGILTDRDLVLRVVAHGKSPAQTRVGDIMTKEPQTVQERTPIEQALALMRAGCFRRLPVVDRHNRLIGLVSLDDILSLLAEEFTQIGTLVEKEMPSQTVDTRVRRPVGRRA